MRIFKILQNNTHLMFIYALGIGGTIADIFLSPRTPLHFCVAQIPFVIFYMCMAWLVVRTSQRSVR
jgi:hypothetical protein